MDYAKALQGEEIEIPLDGIEKALSQLWRAESDAANGAVTRAALWNVVAHTDNDRDRQWASQVLAEVSVHVPQRTIVIKASAGAGSALSSGISANCHSVTGGKQVCSEGIFVTAGGDRIHHLPPLVQALLLPDMPVATWWLGDLPSDQHYVSVLLESSDRLIIDSVHFDSVGDLELVSRIAAGTNTAAADLNWARLEEWRLATASVFDHPEMKARLGNIVSVKLVTATSGSRFFGEMIESIYYSAWLDTQVNGGKGQTKIPCDFQQSSAAEDIGAIQYVEITFKDGAKAEIRRDAVALTSSLQGVSQAAPTVTRVMNRKTPDLILRQLAQQDDAVFRRVLPVATALALEVKK